MALSNFVREYFKICCDKNWDGAEILQCWGPTGNLPPALQGTTLGRNAVLGTKKFNNEDKTVPGGNQYKEYYFPIGEIADENSNETFRFLYRDDDSYVLFSENHYKSYSILQKDSQNYPTTEFKVSSSRIEYSNSDHFWHVPGQSVNAQNRYCKTSPFQDTRNKNLTSKLPEKITHYTKLTTSNAKCYYWPKDSSVLLTFTKL